MRLDVGPITIAVEVPLRQLRVTVAENDSGVTADLVFTGSHDPVTEPRFTRRSGPRLIMDYTRMTQNGRWIGWIGNGDQRITLSADVIGTRDRSWGIRPVGRADSQPAQGGMRQFWWLWTPAHVGDNALFFHSNDDEAGQPWNRRAVLVARDGTAQEFDATKISVTYRPGTRRVDSLSVALNADTHVTMTPRATLFAMSGLGYLHPEWGHGIDHGGAVQTHDSFSTNSIEAGADLLSLHVQVLADVVLTQGGEAQRGVGIIEQMFIGPHGPSGLTGLLDPFAA